MNNKKLKAAGLLTDKQQEFVKAWSGNAHLAARDAGYKNPRGSADQNTSDPAVVAALKRKQDAMAEESGRRLGTEINVCRADIINRLWDLAMMSPETTNQSIYGQIRASVALADIMCMKIPRSLDLPKELEGKTRDQMDHFLIYGYFPESDEKDQQQSHEAPESDTDQQA